MTLACYGALEIVTGFAISPLLTPPSGGTPSNNNIINTSLKSTFIVGYNFVAYIMGLSSFV